MNALLNSQENSSTSCKGKKGSAVYLSKNHKRNSSHTSIKSGIQNGSIISLRFYSTSRCLPGAGSLLIIFILMMEVNLLRKAFITAQKSIQGYTGQGQLFFVVILIRKLQDRQRSASLFKERK